MVVGLAASQGGGAGAADLKAVSAPDKTMTIVLAQRIVAGDAARFSVLTSFAAGKGPVTAVMLDSPGGSVADAIQIAQMVRDGGLKARVPSGAVCASACFIIFAAAGQKFADAGARIGIHSAQVPNGMELDRSAINSGSRTATAQMAAVLQYYGVSERIIGRMVTTPPDQIAWLSGDELRSIGVTVSEPRPVWRRGLR